MYNKIINSTFQIQCGMSTGSGFSFKDLRTIVTNYHVIAQHSNAENSIKAVTESGEIHPLTLISYSPENEHDYAILKMESELDESRKFLEPAYDLNFKTGTEIIFSGYPHGINDLLVHNAIISGRFKEIGFYLDGSVNGGNSGGPIIEKSSGKIIGIVTARRFINSGELDELRVEAQRLAERCKQLKNEGSSMHFMGIDFPNLLKLLAESFELLDSTIVSNANTGIGIGYNINFINERYNRIDII